MAPSNYTSSSRRAAPALQNPTQYQRRRASQDYPDPSVSEASPYQSPLTPEFAAQWDTANPVPSNQYSNLDREKVGSSSHRRRYSQGGQQPGSERISEFGVGSINGEARHFSGSSTETPQRLSRSYSARVKSIPRDTGTVERSSQPVDSDVGQSHHRSASNSAAIVGRPQAQHPNTTSSFPSSHSGQDLLPQRSATTSSRRYSATASSPNQSRNHNDSVSSDGSAQQRRDWAPDKSPLQNLEKTLNEISKEEKRARVEEAEIAARGARGSRGGRGSSSRAMAPTTEPQQLQHHPTAERTIVPNSSLERGISQRQRDRESRSPTTTVPIHPATERPPVTDNRRIERHDQQPHPETIERRGSTRKSQSYRAEATHNTERTLPGPTRGASFRERAGQSGATNPIGATADASANKNVNQSLLRDLQRNQAPNMHNKTSSRVGDPQKALYGDRTGRPMTGDSAGSHEGPPDLVPREQVRTAHKNAPKYHIPPQTEAGREASDRVLGGADSPDAAPKKHHHLTDYLHHGRHRRSKSADGTYHTSMDLDEWKQGGTARLTAADFSISDGGVDHGNTWWEGGGSGKKRRSSGVRGGDARAAFETLDGGYEGDVGTRSYSISRFDDSASNDLPEMRRRIDSVAVPRARQYVGYEGTSSSQSRVRRRNRLWFRLSGSSLGEIPPPSSWTTAISSPYSYSCPQLSEHDIFHPSHICPPDTDRELMRAMRDVRVRTVAESSTFRPPLYLKCGPLLRYTGLRQESGTQSARSRKPTTGREMWRGSVLIVTTDAVSSYEVVPILRLFYQPMDLLPPPPSQLDGEDGVQLAPEHVDPIAGLPKLSRTGETLYVRPVERLQEETDLSRIEDDSGLFESSRTDVANSGLSDAGMRPKGKSDSNTRLRGRDGEKIGNFADVKAVRLHTERGVTFWRFNLEIELTERQTRVAYRINRGPPVGFWVPARGQTMNVMFHSCNGFSQSVDPHIFSGPDPLWRDVLNEHQHRPFHAMLGGGDQIYNDAVMKQTTIFKEWLSIKLPHHKQTAPFTPEMQDELETFYLERYSMWFSQGLFGMANSQIPMVNIWDDHDIIDGFGSYPHHFMSTPVFAGLGAVAFKYYMLFQHQSVLAETEADEPSWLLGAAPGPYIVERSRSVFLHLGRKVAFLGLDARTERMRDEILSQNTYDIVFDRLHREIIKGETKHLIVLLGVPMAYPRLVWLENILTSRLMDPVKALGRRGLLGGFINAFDGGVEILDDLDDHWTAKNHKQERNWFVQELQELAAAKSVRITVLGGDVHLAAVGQFYSNPKLKIRKDHDHRYMPNIISSAIVNTPPPEIMGDVLNKRNKVHHLDKETDEDMIPMFNHDVDGKPRNNKRLLPRRNWCSIREYQPGTTPPPTPPSPESEISQQVPGRLTRTLSLSRPGNLFRRDSRHGPPVHNGDGYMSNSANAVPPSHSNGYFPDHANDSQPTNGSGSIPQRPSPFHRRPTGLEKHGGSFSNDREDDHIDLQHGLDIAINCEVNQKDPAGITMPYRLLVPALWYSGDGDVNMAHLKSHKGTWMPWRSKGGKKSNAVSATPSRELVVDEWGRDGNGRKVS
ncbi:MAG: hypothetical protein M1836_004204 [Candelina mexicana]|nr:MAG: hypothetical protein M1836_004204 [Candelina mexicana]